MKWRNKKIKKVKTSDKYVHVIPYPERKCRNAC